MRSKLVRFFPALSLLVVVAAPPRAQAAQPEIDLRQHYVKSERMIPMRDGVKLFTIIYEPKDKTRRYPFLVARTPYSIPPYGPDEYRGQLGPSPEFDQKPCGSSNRRTQNHFSHARQPYGGAHPRA